jgi:hypothetical protein
VEARVLLVAEGLHGVLDLHDAEVLLYRHRASLSVRGESNA